MPHISVVICSYAHCPHTFVRAGFIGMLRWNLISGSGSFFRNVLSLCFITMQELKSISSPHCTHLPFEPFGSIFIPENTFPTCVSVGLLASNVPIPLYGNFSDAACKVCRAHCKKTFLPWFLIIRIIPSQAAPQGVELKY